MADGTQTPIALPILVEQRLEEEDDPALWAQFLKAMAEDASVLRVANTRSNLFAEVGVCSHWLRPHQTRWPAAGGFAAPLGYGHSEGFARCGLPGFDWSVKLQFDPILVQWIVPPELPAKGSRFVRIAVPARTTRHRQAAVHTVWPPGTLDGRQKRTVFYGFRNLTGIWELTARSSDRQSRSS